jgi:hypothetical protein
MSMTELNNENPESVRSSLARQLKKRYAAYGLDTDTDDYKMLFSDLIQKLSERGKVVILIDEYDRPMLTHIGDPETAKAVRRIMQEFYLVIKDADADDLLKMVFLTGITKICKAGIFSTLNHLDELTTKEEYASMLGYTREELEATFDERLEEGAVKLNISRDELLAKIKDYYNGFSFDGKHSVYNPFSILNFFSEYDFQNYWIRSGLPSSLLEYAKIHTLRPEDYLGTYLHPDVLTSYEIEQAPPESFLFQSGYLTFKDKDPYLGYLLGYPNREVRDSFSRLVLESTYDTNRETQTHLQRNIIMALRARKFQPIFDAMKQTMANIPGKLYNKEYQETEAYYHSIILTLLWACELHVHAEEYTSLGISDLVLDFEGDIYVMELKTTYAKTALTQIQTRGYAEKYKSAPYLALIGIAIDTEKRNLRDYAFDNGRS